MEANFFRVLATEAIPLLVGARIQNVYAPAPGLWSFKLSSSQFLILSPSKSGGALFFTTSPPDNPQAPPARAMWFRKRIKGARVTEVRPDWMHRRLGLRLEGTEKRWMVLDVCAGPELTESLDEVFGSAPDWPDLDEVLSTPDIWKTHPQITPPLRRSLSRLSADEAARLYEAVKGFQIKSGPFYVYSRPAKGAFQVLAWPQPGMQGPELEARMLPSALEAAAVYGRDQVRTVLDRLNASGTLLKRRLKKVKRALRELEQEEKRMHELIDLQEKGELIQANLYRLDPRLKAGRAAVLDGAQEVIVETDPRLTLLENMGRFFSLARKGRRGLSHLARRRKELEGELAELEAGRIAPALVSTVSQGTRRKDLRQEGRWKNLAVHVYTSSDGFTMLRGKNQKANHNLLSQAARPFDLWFHAQDGPGAHVILKRDHDGQEVPEASLKEAAVLAGLASHQSRSDQAQILCALVRDVRKIKGAGLGRVRIDKAWRTFSVNLDPDLENTLRR